MPQRQQLCYLLDSGCQISIGVGQRAPSGSGTEPQSVQPFVPRTLMSGSRGSGDSSGAFPRYVDAQDRQILGALTSTQIDGPWKLRGERGAELLRRARSTGRAHWQSLESTPLRAGGVREIAFSWETLTNGDQRLRCEPAGALTLLMDVSPPAYIDATSGESGDVQLPCADDIVRRYWNRAPIAPEQVSEINAQIAREAGTGFPRLRELEVRKQPVSSLKGKLLLSAHSIAPSGAEAALHFVYNELPIDSASLLPEQQVARRFSGEAVYEFNRDHDGEARLRARLANAFAQPSPASEQPAGTQPAGTQPASMQPASMQPTGDLSREAWLSFMTSGVPALRAEGWDVVVSDYFPYRIVQPESWYGELTPGHQDSAARPAQNDRRTRGNREREWFDLRLGVVVDGQTVNLLPALVNYLQATLGGDSANHPIDDPAYCRVGEQLFVHLEDGRYVPVSMARVERIAQTLVELFEGGGLSAQHTLRLPRAQANRLAQQPDDIALQSEDSALLAHIEGVRAFGRIRALPAPPHFRTTLRPYQREGLGWLQFLRANGTGGILADDMGLGKTVQTLAHLSLEKHEGRLRKPTLIVAPVSVIGNWQQELRQLAPELNALTLHGSRRKELFASIPRADVVITGYPLLQIDSEVLLAHEFYMVILDEAQTIKNPRAKVSRAACALRAEHRLCLTGTPMENHLGELWSLFEFLQPGMLDEERQFQRLYRTPVEKSGDMKRFQALTERIAPFVLRRTKDAVAEELPPKTQIVESVVLEQSQRDFYDGIRLAMHRHVREVIEQQGLARSHITVLDALLKLRQACCDPRLLGADSGAGAVPSAKMEWLVTMLPELVAEGRRILLFSQFTSMLRLIEAAVQELGIPYCLLTGETQNRAALVERFQSGAVALFLISLKAGGTGLNLTAADTVIHYDPWWNPAAEAQATDRAHRIGQDKPVFVYKLIAQGTVEEKIMQLQADKHALASRLYAQHGALPSQLGTADVEGLFEP